MQPRHHPVGLGQDVDVDRGQAHVVAGPAAVDEGIDRAADDLGRHLRLAPGLLEQRRLVPPVEAQHHVGGAQDLHAFVGGEGDGRLRPVQRMIGGEGAGDLQIGEHARAQHFRQTNALGPGGLVARHPAGEDHRRLRAAQQFRRHA